MITVGTSGGVASPYGTYDQTGNVMEWVDVGSSSSQVIRGGGFAHHGGWIMSYNRTVLDPASDYMDYGFRLASTYQSPSGGEVPEPSTLLIGTLFGLGGVLGKRRLKK